ncbi:MAG: hypothetical protein KC583_13710, partial [Myxococcales bacterium]|nr:hypothetical protein [Myxococcales bacterium]
RPGVPSTDVDRLALAVRAPDAEATIAAVEAAALAAGYARDAKGAHLLRHPDRITLASKRVGDTVVLHHQRRWRRPDEPPTDR